MRSVIWLTRLFNCGTTSVERRLMPGSAVADHTPRACRVNHIHLAGSAAAFPERGIVVN
jgi:hypothetical protein